MTDLSVLNAAERRAVGTYVRTGRRDVYSKIWRGANFVESETRSWDAMRAALVEEVRRREAERPGCRDLNQVDPAELTRARVAPMVAGLFPADEQSVVLELLQRSVVFVTPKNIHALLAASGPLSATWDLANLYLHSIGAPLLGKKAPRLLGISEDRTCFVSVKYFSHSESLADFIVHECAHVFHNCKRHTLGLRETRTREWLLELEFKKRETFAYACEAYSRLLELGEDRSARAALLEEHGKGADLKLIENHWEMRRSSAASLQLVDGSWHDAGAKVSRSARGVKKWAAPMVACEIRQDHVGPDEGTPPNERLPREPGTDPGRNEVHRRTGAVPRAEALCRAELRGVRA